MQGLVSLCEPALTLFFFQVFPSTLDQEKMHGESPYNIMFGKQFLYVYPPLSCVSCVDMSHFSYSVHLLSFLLQSFAGPDICGPGTKKVHVIFSYKGKNHLVKKEIRCKVGWFV